MQAEELLLLRRKAFHPRQVKPDLLLDGAHYNASTGTWTDTSGRGNHALQATAGRRPTTISSPFPGVAFTGTHLSSGKYVEGPLAGAAHYPAMMWIVARSPASQLGTLFTTRRQGEPIDDNVHPNLQVRNGVVGTNITAYDVEAAGSNGAASNPTANAVRVFKILWTADEVRITDGVGEWMGSDITQWISRVARTVGGYRIGCAFHNDGVFVNPLLGDIFYLVLKIGSVSESQTRAMDRYLHRRFNVATPYEWTPNQPVIVPTTTAPSPAKNVVQITNSGYSEHGVPATFARRRLGANIRFVGGSDATLDDGTIRLDGQGGKTWDFFRRHADSPLTSATNTLDLPAWLATVTDSGGTPRTPTHILWSLWEGVCLNNLAAAVPAAFADELVFAEQLFAAMDLAIPGVQHLISTPFGGNGRPTSTVSPVGGYNWTIHSTIESWNAARDATVALVLSTFTGRYPIFRFDLAVDRVAGWLEREGVNAGLHETHWHGSRQQGEALATFLRATLWA